MYSQLTWPEAVRIAINSIGWLPYGSDHLGSFPPLTYRGQTLLAGGAFSQCVTAVYEALVRAILLKGGAYYFSVDDMKLLKSYTFVYEEPDTRPQEGQYFKGVAAGIADKGKGLALGDWVVDSLEGVGDPSKLESGDMVQFYDLKGDEVVFGHSAVVVGQTVNKSGAPAVGTWSSDPDTNGGHGYDYWSYESPSSSKRRIWFGAQLSRDVSS